GWDDVSFHGSPQIPTPNMDVLAGDGVILNNYYVQQLCTPSRAALMTGLYPIHNGLQDYVIQFAEPNGLPLNLKVMPQFFKDIGYETHMIGKVTGVQDEPFLAHDSGVGDQERILVLGTPKNFERLSTAKAWFMDGTFKVTPSLFYEVYTVHGLYRGAVISLAYALLPNKQEVTYRRLFSVLTSLLSSVAVEAIYCYFEAVVITTCSRIFPQAKIQGRIFHLCQSVDRRLCKLGFQARYGNDEEVQIRMLPALAFLPPAEVPDAFDALLEVFPTEVTDLAMYFEDTYIGRRRRNGVQAAMFSTSLWGYNFPLRGAKGTLWEGGTRGSAFIWSPLLNQNRRVSDQMLHITDWLPTLYSAAGGNPVNLGKVDGYDMWTQISYNLPSSRYEVLYNIDPTDLNSALRYTNYKLVLGTYEGGEFDQRFRTTGGSRPYGDLEIAMAQSKAARVLKGFYNRGNFLLPRNWRQKATVSCVSNNGPRNFVSQAPPYLFDLAKDPCELNNIARAEAGTRLRKEFLPAGHATQILRELEARTQHPDESLVWYCRVMQELFQRANLKSLESDR
ncbi:hypothetical protein HPB47_006974, partial [Ixodes persulcatus]